MKIILTDVDSDTGYDKQLFTLDDDSYDGKGYVDIHFPAPTATLHISELKPAVDAYYQAYMQQLERDEKLS